MPLLHTRKRESTSRGKEPKESRKQRERNVGSKPPQDCLLILIACNAGGLLPTLRSRCLRLSFGSLPRDVLSRFLVCSKGMNPEEADVLAAMAMGSVGAADRIDGEELRSRRRSWIGLLASLDGGDYRSA